MTIPIGWFEVHDGNSSKRKYPEGRPMLIRGSAINSLRGYEEGRVRCVIGYNGTYLHVTETQEDLVERIRTARRREQ